MNYQAEADSVKRNSRTGSSTPKESKAKKRKNGVPDVQFVRHLPWARWCHPGLTANSSLLKKPTLLAKEQNERLFHGKMADNCRAARFLCAKPKKPAEMARHSRHKIPTHGILK